MNGRRIPRLRGFVDFVKQSDINPYFR
ncbi:hypothetical protein THIOKS12980005 [Thiocapsa sp. KS1]|nr:hypothetical protein THIOKS12980005 [Thiocapsa sp. KS1]